MKIQIIPFNDWDRDPPEVGECGWHKGRPILSCVEFLNEDEDGYLRPMVDGIRVFVAELEDGWWVVAQFSYDDQHMPDQGPFKTHEDAALILTLTMDS